MKPYAEDYIPEVVYYHMHSFLSNGTTNIDSVTNFRDYIPKVKEFGSRAFALSEHGNLFEWLHKKEAIEAAGMKYIHAMEAYLTEDISEIVVSTTGDIHLPNGRILTKAPLKEYHQSEQGDWIATADYEIDDKYATGFLDYDSLKINKEPNKIRDNYHCVLIAKNHDGFIELNKLASKAFTRTDGHFYYMPRITFNELFATSDNILVTTACLGGALRTGTDVVKEKMVAFLAHNKHRCYLEVQHHNTKEQKEYNRYLYELSKVIDVPLIAGTDTHALNADHMAARAIMQKAKNVWFANEEAWNLILESPKELVESYKKQNALPYDVFIGALEETTKMADRVEPFEVDYSPKYPKLYDNSEEVFKQKINEGTIRRGIHKLPNRQEYYDRIHSEYETYKHNGAIDFMLLEEDYKSEMRKQGVRFGYSRGSVSGSLIAYLLGITEVDSIKYNLNFSRFMNKERVSLADFRRRKSSMVVHVSNDVYYKSVNRIAYGCG